MLLYKDSMLVKLYFSIDTKKREPLVVVPHQEALALPCTVERTTNRAHADMTDKHLENDYQP